MEPATYQNTHQHTQFVSQDHKPGTAVGGFCLTSREDTGADHLVNIEEDHREPANVVAQGRVRFDRRADGLLPGGPRPVLRLRDRIGKLSITDDRDLGA